jgi:TP901 family phage tail tape measure protein
VALAERATLVAELRLDDKMSRGLTKAGRSLRGLEGATKRAGAGLSHLGGLLATAGKVAAVGAAGVVVASVKMAGDFEAALNTINTVAGATPAQLTKIGDSMRELSRKTGTDLTELTTGYYDLVSAGIKAADAQGVLTAANTLAIGGLATTGETIDLLTTALNSYGMKANQAGKVADYFAQAIAAGKVTAAELASSFAQVASIAASSGIEIQELAAGYAQLTAKGVPAAEAATQMRSAIVALTKVTSPLEKLQKQTGLTYLKIAGQKGLAFALEVMRKDAKKAGVPLIDLLGRVEGLNYTLGVTGPNFKSYNKNLKDVNESAGTAAEQMAEREKGLNHQLEVLSANARDAAITIGSALLPKLTPLAVKLNEFLNKPETRAGIADLADKLASGFETAAKWAGTIDWGSLASALNIAASGAKALVGAFLSMPPEVQGTIIALAGLNKLTGGAVSGIVGELGKGLIKGVLGMNAGVVNINAAVVNGAGRIPGAAAAAGGVAAGTGAALVTAVIAPAAVAAAALIISDQINKQGAELVTQASEFAFKATDSELAASIEGVRKQLDGMVFNTFDSKNKVIATLNTLIAEQNRRATGANNVTGGRGDASTAQRVKDQSIRAGISERAIAAGFKPTAATIERTFERNRQAILTLDAREAQRSATLQSAVTAAQDRTTAAARAAAVASALTGGIIRAKDMSPTVNVAVRVTNSVSVRQIGRAVAVNSRWQAGSRNVDRIP